MAKRTVTIAGLWLRKLADRHLTQKEIVLLANTQVTGVKFIEIFKNEVMEGEGGNRPSLYEMVLLELIGKSEVQTKFIINQGIDIERLKRSKTQGT